MLWNLNIGVQLTGISWVDAVITILWVAGITNAFNLLDNMDGWFYPKLIEDVQRFEIHEVSSHGYTHLPFHNEFVTRDTVKNELLTMNKFMQTKDVTLQSMIYPRNQVAHTDLLNEVGIHGYRDSQNERSAYGSKNQHSCR